MTCWSNLIVRYAFLVSFLLPSFVKADPPSLPTTNLRVHLKADAGTSTTTDGEPVSSWIDQTGNGLNASQSIPGNQPTYLSNGINGLPSVHFNGNNQFLELTSTSTIGIQSSPYEIFIVARSSNSNIQFLYSGPNYAFEMHLNGAAGLRNLPKYGIVVDQGTDGQYTTGDAHSFHIQVSSALSASRVDGQIGPVVASDSRSSEDGPLRVGLRMDNGFPFYGDIAEIIIYNAVLSAADRAAVGTYIQSRYGITMTTVLQPTVQTSNVTFSDSTAFTAKVTVTKGDGAKRLILMKAGGAVDAFPTDGEQFSANAAFGSGTQFGTGNYAVHAGTDSVVTVTGLTPNTTYHVAAVEYNGSSIDQDLLLTAPATGSMTTPMKAPDITVGASTSMTATTGTLNGTVNTYSLSTTYRFIYGTDHDALSDTTAPVVLSASGTPTSVSANITGLSSNTLYYVRIIAVNAGGTTLSGFGTAYFDAAAIPKNGLSVWLNGSVGVIAAADQVRQWTDLSGANHNAVQNNADYRPNLVTGSINGKSVLTFTPGNWDHLMLPPPSELGIQNHAYDIYVVMRSADNSEIQFITGGTVGHYELHLNSVGGVRYGLSSGTFFNAGNVGDYGDGVPHLIQVNATGSGNYLRVDGSIGGYQNDDGRSASNDSIAIGKRLNNSYFLNGSIAELLIYSTPLNSTDRLALQSYLASKYAMTITGTPVQPTAQATDLQSSSNTGTSIALSVTPGDGARRVIIMKQGSAVDGFPTDGQFLSASSTFGSGTELGSGNYVVYSGTGSSVSVSGLSYGISYHIAVLEYNGSVYEADYLTTSPLTGSVTMNSTTPTVSTSGITGMTVSSYTLNGSVSPNGAGTIAKFAYGTNPAALTDSTAGVDVGSGTASVAVNATVTGAPYGTMLYARLVARNTNGTSVSGLRTIYLDTTVIRSNMKLWLRADAGTSTTTEDAAVTTWTDLSGNGNDAASGTGPTYKASAINSKPALHFDGSQSFTLPAAANLGLLNSDYEILVVARTAAPEIQFLYSVTGGVYEMHLNGGLGVRFMPMSGSYLDQGSEGSYANGAPHLFAARVSEENGYVRVDGIDGGAAGQNARTSYNSAMFIGKRQGDSYYLNGDIAEMLIYNAVLTAEQRTKVETALAQKYGITSGALPVELTAFTAQRSGRGVELVWRTATETNNLGFHVQRRTGTGVWTPLGFVEGHGTTSAPQQYRYVDAGAAGTAQYRLQQVDRDGKSSYSQTVEVAAPVLPAEFGLTQNYPNPFNPSTAVTYRLTAPGIAVLKVYDIVGREVATLSDGYREAGVHTATFDAAALPSGMYIARLTSGGKQTQIRMLLMK